MGLFDFFGSAKTAEAASPPVVVPLTETTTVQDFTSIYNYDSDVIKGRSIIHQIHPMILARRSERSMDGKPVDNAVLMSLFEAARWTPSHYNCQNWRFVYTTRDSPHWNSYLDCLWKLNRAWAKDAGVLVVAMSKKTTSFLGKTMQVSSHSFEAGSAWMAMALEGTARGLVMHAMGGIDKDKISDVIGLKKTDDYQIEAMIAIGNRKQEKGFLGGEKISQRYDIHKFISEGTFTEKL